MTLAETVAILVRAREWLNGSGSTLRGAAAALHGISMLSGPLLAGSFAPPSDEKRLIEMILSEGSPLRAPMVSVDQHAVDLEKAVSAAIAFAIKGNND